MENQRQQNKISAGDFYSKKNMPTSNAEWTENRTMNHWWNQIFRNTSGSQVKLEKTHTYQTQRTRITTMKNMATDYELWKMWLLDKKSQLTTENKLLLYKAIFKPIWVYDIQLWDRTSNWSIEILQRFQNKIFRIIVDAPWYITNDTLYQDLNISYIRDEIRRHSQRYADRMKEHPNILTKNLMRSIKTPRRLKRRIPQDLCTWLVEFYRMYINGHIFCKIFSFLFYFF